MIYPSMPRYAAFFRRAFVPDAKSRWEPFSCLILAKDEPAVNEALLDLLSVRYVVIPAGWTKHAEFFRSRGYPVAHQSTRVTIFTNEDAYPRAFVVPALVERAETPDMIPTSGRQVACTTDRQLIADAARFGIATRAPEAGAPAPTSRAEVVTYDHARVVIDIVGDKPGVLVLMDAWHPHWRASLDGSPCHLGVANEAFRGIAVPAGKHRVEMTYHRAGAGPSAVLLMLVGAALGTLLVMRRKVDGWLLSPASHD